METLSGKFVVFEGISGAGKSTQVTRFMKAIPNSLFNAEPTNRGFGAAIRAIIERRQVPEAILRECKEIGEKFLSIAPDKLSEYFWRVNAVDLIERLERGAELNELDKQLLYMIDRVCDLLWNILPARKQGRHVGQDRYWWSTFAYGDSGDVGFGEMTGLQIKLLLERSGADLGDSYIPDLTKLFDLDAGIATKRLEVSGKVIDIFETYERLKKIRERYLELAKYPSLSKKVVIIDASRSEEEVFKDMIREVHSLLGSKAT